MEHTQAAPEYPALFIAIEGATGIGKTTLATRLAARLCACVALDPFEQNQFLPVYCQAPKRQRDQVALPMEMSFLALRVSALRSIAQYLSRGGPVVADWALIKSRVFAALTLSASDAGIFFQALDLWAADLPVPDLIVHLHADSQTLAARVRSRGRGFEKDLSETELAAQDRLFTAVLARTDLNVVTVDATTFDAFSDSDIAALTAKLSRARRWDGA